MADKKVSELSNVSVLYPQDLTYVVQSGASKSLPLSFLFDNVPQTRFTGNVSYSSEETITSPGIISAAAAITNYLPTDREAPVQWVSVVPIKSRWL